MSDLPKSENLRGRDPALEDEIKAIFPGRVKNRKALEAVKEKKLGVVDIPASKDLGPKMRALPTDRMKRFVLALVRGASSYSEAARMAGYTGDNCSVIASSLMRRQDILEAIKEETDRRLYAGLALSADVLLAIIKDPATKAVDKLKALELLDRWCGSPSKQAEKKSEPTADQSEKEMVQRLSRLAKELDIDPAKLLGDNIPVDIDQVADEVHE
jgi:hypothetical protein